MTGPGRRRGVRAACTALVAFVVLLLGAGPAAAHSELVWTAPNDGQVFGSTSPADVRLSFSEKVQERLSTVRLLGPGGQVRTGALVHPEHDATTLEASVPAELPDGGYTVAWRVVSADGHPVDGAYGFRVGDVAEATADGTGVAPPAPTADPDHSRAVDVLHTASRWTGFLGFSLLVGPAAFVALCWPGGRGSRGLRRLALWGWALTAGSTTATLLLDGPHVAGVPLAGVRDAALLTATLHTRVGVGLLVRLGLLALALPLLRVLLRPGRASRVNAVVVLALATALAVTWSATGHGGVGADVALALPADAAHLVAMAVWTGGLAGLLVMLWRHEHEPGVPAAVAAFSPVAVVSVVVLVASGGYQSWRQVRSLPALDTGYGRVLLLKVATVVGLVLLGALARSWSRRPAVVAGGRRPERAPGRGRVRRLVLVEAGAAVVVLGLSSVLVGLEPARLAAAQADVPSPSRPLADVAPALPRPPGPVLLPFDGGPLGKGFLAVEVLPPRTGQVAVHLTVVDLEGRVLPVAEAGVSLALPAQDLRGLQVPLTAAGPGHFAGAVSLPTAGVWELTATVRTSRVDQVSARTRVTVRA
ncbi:MAG: hypothetical protein JWM64_2589 [Frankiales bacterium]|nr:hypothetical protein [Frankiales bacterium]